MINLLPPQTKRDLLYARRNRSLLIWSVLLGIALLLIAGITAGGYIYLTQSTKSFEKRTLAANQQLNDQSIDEVKSEIETTDSNIRLAISVLSREILFSKLLTQLGANLPANSTLTQLQIDKVSGGLSISAQATDVSNATQVQVNLQDPKNLLFEKADIETINCEPVGRNIYPCKIQLRALFNKDNPFLLLQPNSPAANNQQGAATP